MDERLRDQLLIEPAGPAGMEAGANIFARAMGRDNTHTKAKLLKFSRQLAETGIGRFVIARHKDRPVGYGSLVTYRHIGWIGFMGTVPDLQRRGVGASIMRKLLKSAEEAGLKTLKLDATNVGKKLYSKCGFKEEYPARRFEIPGVCTRGTPRDIYTGLVRIMESMPGWCSSLDLRAFGDDRTPLIETAFRHGAKLLVVSHRGFGLLEGRKLGPVVAVDLEAAMEIVRWASGLGANVVYVAERPALPRKFLAGLKPPPEDCPITCCTRMSRGETVAQELDLVYADYSAATG